MKNRMNFSAFLLSTFFLSTAYSTNHLVFMGGGGEPAGQTTIFDQDAANLSGLTKSGKWSYQASFNGGHPISEAIINQTFSHPESPNSVFSEKNYNALIDDSLEKMRSGKLKAGDQLLIVIDTHGAEKNDKELSHSIAFKSKSQIADYDSLNGLSIGTLDRLNEIVKLADEQGVKLGIVDMSCHSGATLNLAKKSKNTCVIASSGPNHYAHAGPGAFANNFFAEIKQGRLKNLEDLYLKARKDFNNPSFPMISTPAGKAINDELYAQIGPYINYQSETNGKLTKQLIDLANPIEQCREFRNFNKLLTNIEIFQEIADQSNGDLQSLKELLMVYHEAQQNMIKNVKSSNVGILNKEITIASSTINPRKNQPYYSTNLTVKELLKIDKIQFQLDSEAEFEAVHQFAPDNKLRKQAHTEYLNNLFKEIDKINKQYPNLASAEEQIRLKNERILKNTYDIAQSIAQKERTLYQAMYEAKKAPNPCADFKL